MIIKLIKNPNSNSIEATWSKEKTIITSVIVEKDIDGELTRVKEDKESIIETVEYCQSFSDLQIDLLREYIEKFETALTEEQEALIKEVELNRVPLSQEEIKTIEIENEKQRVLLIKQEAGRIIESKYSIYKQLNITNLLEGYTTEDKTKMIDFINKIRAISNKAELEGTALENINWSI